MVVEDLLQMANCHHHPYWALLVPPVQLVPKMALLVPLVLTPLAAVQDH